MLVIPDGLDSVHPCDHADGSGDRPVFDDEGEVGVGSYPRTALNHRYRNGTWSPGIAGHQVTSVAGRVKDAS
jgi:hypothetical protein